ncbi:hypothetical protein [Spirosoma flavum]|uniref:O-antigen polysaccharide polymerase Wzy n=1 Tax=Spirosoma flavum TaxID=2048557 RepID=A0ABW6AIC6_9BACT
MNSKLRHISHHFSGTASEEFAVKIVRWSWVVLVISSIFQCIFFQSLENFVAVGCVLIVWSVVTNVFLRSSTLKNFPLSTFLLLGFSSTQFYFPLLFTLLEGKPIVFNLELPFEVFFHSMAAFFVLVLVHIFYQILSEKWAKGTSSLFERAGFFAPPSDLQLWIMGIIGVASTYYVWLYSPSVGWSPTGAAEDKVVQALIPFSYAPYFIPFGRLYGRNAVTTKRLLIMLATFTLILFLVSIARNSRSGFMLGFASVGFAYGLGALLNYFKPRFFTLRNSFIAAIIFWLFTGPIADIGTAMAMVRGQRLDIPYSELIELTLEAFNDKDAIRVRRLADNTEKQDWDEIYMDNIFIQRFSNLKYNDASLVMAAKLGDYDTDLLNFTIDHFLSTLPLPVLEFLGLNVNKEMINSNSYGDYFYYQVTASPWVLEAFRTGHFAGTGMATFGWWYLLILAIGIFPVYVLFDKLAIREYKNTSSVIMNNSNVRFSFCGLLSLTSIFQFLPFESVEVIGSFFLRGWIQMVLLYFLFYHFTRLISTFIQGDGSSMQVKRSRLYTIKKI